MILFDDIVEIFDLLQFHAFRQDSIRFEVGNSLGIGRIHIDSDHTMSRRGGVGVSRSSRLCHLLLDRTSLRS
jgi:hypothetical protein